MFKQAAQEYLSLGFSVIPVGSNKKPLISWKPFQKKRPSEEQVEIWSRRYPDANIGIITGKISNLCVIDIDSKKGEETLERYLPEGLLTPTVETPSGGKHKYFLYPEGVELRSNVRHIEGCDLRAEGGYVVAPPSHNGKGKHYKFLVSFEKAQLSELPQAYIEIAVSSPHFNKKNNKHKTVLLVEDEMFVEGRRDTDLFTVANALAKQGFAESVTRQVIEKLAESCNPPFPFDEARRKIQSAYSRVEYRKGEVMGPVRDAVALQNGVFTVADVMQSLQSLHCKPSSVRCALKRMCDNGEIKKYGTKSGVYKNADSSLEKIDFLNASDESLDIKWPFEIERYVYIQPKSIVVVAGASNAGKTCFLLNTVELNMNSFNIRYFSSEMGSNELRARLKKFERPLHSWKFEPFERSSDFEDVIEPADINIIDYLEIHSDFYEVSGLIREIYDKLDTGIAIIALQKNPGASLGLGANRSIEKARLYLSMDTGRISIIKGKNWVNSEINPNGLVCRFEIRDGCRFTIKDDWKIIGR